ENVLPVQRLPHPFAVSDVAVEHFDLLAPWHSVKLGGCARDHPDIVTVCQQCRNKTGAKVASGAEYDAAHAYSSVGWDIDSGPASRSVVSTASETLPAARTVAPSASIASTALR